MTSEEREQFAASLGQKVSKENFVYLYDLDGKPQMFIKSMFLSFREMKFYVLFTLFNYDYSKSHKK